MNGARPRPRPCASCPYRRDAPSGLWAREEYEKLRGYDGDVPDQIEAGAFGVFHCHSAPESVCAGWAGCHNMWNSLAVRVNAAELDMEAILTYESPVPLFASGSQAADHGEKMLDSPPPATMTAAAKITRLIARRKGNRNGSA